MSRKFPVWCLVATLAISILGAPAWAVPVSINNYTGTRTSALSGGILGAGSWANGGFELSWDIRPLGGAFSYSYSITGPDGGALSKDLSHWLLQVSDTFTPANLLWSSGTVVNPTTYSEGAQGNSNPGLFGSIYALKFDYGSDGSVVYSFLSTREPMWGDFYAKSGVDAIRSGQGGRPQFVDVVAWNLGFGVDPVAGYGELVGYGAWIAVPNTLDLISDDPVNPIPEPGTLALFAIGLAALGFMRHRQTH
jgi:hypothetical protein